MSKSENLPTLNPEIIEKQTYTIEVPCSNPIFQTPIVGDSRTQSENLTWPSPLPPVTLNPPEEIQNLTTAYSPTSELNSPKSFSPNPFIMSKT